MKKVSLILLATSFIGIANIVQAQSFWHQQKTQQAKVILTNAKSNEKFADKGTAVFQDFPQPKETDICVFVAPKMQYQTIFGFGGAITDASAEVFAKLPKEKQTELLNAYYGKSGLGYNIVRTNMNSCDFSSDSYTYVKDNDTSLSSFSVKHDEAFKIPLIKKAQELINPKEFKFFFSPWSPPAWMKSNKNMLKGGRLENQYYATWANYYIKFIQEYEKRKIPVWGLSVQNEPMAVQTWESCIYTADEEADFLGNYLGPTLWKNGYKDKKVIIWDHNRDLIFQRATTTLQNPEVAKYASGIGFHWYETWNNNSQLFNNVAEVHKAFPDKFLMFTEGCKEKFDFSQIYDVSIGELYGKNMINDFNTGVSAWCEWNILLDEKGGPNHVGNYCFAPIIADTKTGELHYTYEYYYIGQFSKFVKPNAKRVGTSTNKDYLLATSFINEEGQLIVVVMNDSNNDTEFNLCIEGKATKLSSPAHSIQTIIL